MVRVTLTTYIYARIYWNSHVNKISKNLNLNTFDIVSNQKYFTFYVGMTNDMKRRHNRHNKNLCKITNRYNKSYEYLETRYIKLNSYVDKLKITREIEASFKRLSFF